MKSFWPGRRTLSEARLRADRREMRKRSFFATRSPAAADGKRNRESNAIFTTEWLFRLLGLYLVVLGASILLTTLIF